MESKTPDIAVFFIDDDPAVLTSAAQTLELSGFHVRTFDNAAEAIEEISPHLAAVVVVDVRMPGMDGHAFLKEAVSLDGELPVIMLTGHGDVDMAVTAMRNGAWDFLQKPVHPRQLVECVERATRHRAVVLENRAFRNSLQDQTGIRERLIGQSAGMVSLRETVAALATTDVNILIRGETGSGKEEVARCLHEFGPRKDRNFVAINCGAVPGSMIESELFGHEKGAFTGADKRRIGKLEHADGGTVFLDEIESMPLDLQVRLLRVLQDKVIEPIGGNRIVPVDIRFIAASKDDLHERALAGSFREDLYYRLHVAEIFIPPLRERHEDIPVLFRTFLSRAADRLDRPLPPVSPELDQDLLSHTWPGNVRELISAAERYVLGLPLTGSSGGKETPSPTSEGHGLQQRLEQFEKSLILRTLAAHGGSMQKTADELKIPYKTLYLRVRKYGIDKNAVKAEPD
ncbi:sigma-54-dependent transcriptional regulator [Sneathiella chinensis]|uniref:Sigma-54-dependent Fis family transcriptional regulator n=1 Tax=Sneathiella chinensis TaxID=349750 RepID=A0ABQ5U2U2_9PROT|nr:sigma-54 dependent transcriptional regulator [Sneathiella chinensis]GLQ06484.1 sigma-54-dependent Fis family transcriptional regulator [Sneathiella chinensis]